MSLLGVLDSNRVFELDETKSTLEEQIVSAVLSVEACADGDEPANDNVVHALIDAHSHIVDQIDEENDTQTVFIEPGEGHAAYRESIKRYSIGAYQKTAEEIEEHLISTFMPEINWNKIVITKKLLTRIAMAVVSREKAIGEALQAYMKAHA